MLAYPREERCGAVEGGEFGRAALEDFGWVLLEMVENQEHSGEEKGKEDKV